ncbi:putative zinc finger ring-type protein [Neofusicoccum parvum UCRNP2]|uniref:Putative zinc finger ring-type protein n=1 Tax=Botryosphaeria parva (strain UCR-NP2) TaxID=1287680 RepID=R1GUV3_BOTPV|nr:putative zinc finger ring-type protein [Neofusicoccum parvum UCRNP2]
MANQHVQDVQNATRNFCDPTGALKGEFGLWIENLEGDTATPYKMLYEAAEWSALLHYFSDRKHNTLDRPIEPDGSNIQHLGLLRDTFDWYTKWMSLLHQKKILRIMYEDKEVLLYYWETDWQRLKRFKPTMCEAKIDMLEGLEEEIYGSPVEHLAVIFEHRQELTWVWHWRQSVLETLFEMQNAAERFPGTHADKEMAVRRAFMKMPPSTWLLVRLIDAEQTFESELQYWHVEDEHIKKRLFVLDDKNFARLMPCGEAIPTWDEKENDDDEWRFSDEGLAEFNKLIEEAENWGIDGDYSDMPDDLWEAWAKHLRRKMVDEQLEGDPVELTGEVPDPTADWPRPEPEDSRAAQDEEDEEL